MNYAFALPVPPSVAIADSDERFPVHRIYCIGRNYADHAREMGAVVDRGQPTFFSKPADAIVTGDADVPYPPATANLHHEVEMVVALSAGGHDIAAADAQALIFGYGIGLDLTRRDLQAIAKKKGLPWDTAKGFDHAAPISALRRAADIGHPQHAQISLRVNDELRQQSDIEAMLWPVANIIAELSRLFELRAGDLIFTGTPAGVAPLRRGDRFVAELQGIARLRGKIV